MDHKRVINELSQGREFAKQLQVHLVNPSSTLESQEIFIHNILESYHKSLSLLTTHGESHFRVGNGKRITRMESHVSFGERPPSEDSVCDFKNPNHKDFGVKRKSMETQTYQMKVRGDMEFEEALDGTYSWRKYGQKDILGSKHPRCTYRQIDGYLATKQVPKTNKNPTTYNMTNQGSHTCNLGTNPTSTLPLLSSLPPRPYLQHPPQENQLLQSPEVLSTYQTSYKSVTEIPETASFHYPLTSNNSFIFPTLDETIDGNKSPIFIPLVTSGTTNFTSQARVTKVVGSELSDIVYASTSSTTSHKVDVTFPFGELGFGNFNYDNSIFCD